jgi:hypothetical protein
MGGKGGGDSGAMQQPTSTIDTTPEPLDLTKDQEFIDVQRAARDATAPATAPTTAATTPSLGDTAAATVQSPDYWTNRGLLEPTPIKKSSLKVTGSTGSGKTGTGSSTEQT